MNNDQTKVSETIVVQNPLAWNVLLHVCVLELKTLFSLIDMWCSHQFFFTFQCFHVNETGCSFVTAVTRFSLKIAYCPNESLRWHHADVNNETNFSFLRPLWLSMLHHIHQKWTILLAVIMQLQASCISYVQFHHISVVCVWSWNESDWARMDWIGLPVFRSASILSMRWNSTHTQHEVLENWNSSLQKHTPQLQFKARFLRKDCDFVSTHFQKIHWLILTVGVKFWSNACKVKLCLVAECFWQSGWTINCSSTEDCNCCGSFLARCSKRIWFLMSAFLKSSNFIMLTCLKAFCYIPCRNEKSQSVI